MDAKKPRRETAADPATQAPDNLVATGIEGLDSILHGGLTPNRLYLVEGHPGAGKTTLALQFLMEGKRRGERCLYVTLSESERELHDVAESHGWSFEGIHLVEMIPSEESLKPDSRYTMFHPSEVELTETTRTILAEAERTRPVRAVIDSLSEFRLLAQNSLRHRRQILVLKQFFARQESTVLLVDDRADGAGDEHLFSIAHGVISMERRVTEYGPIRRQLQIAKLRGRAFREGFHDFKIQRGGLAVYPRIVASDHREPATNGQLRSGIVEVDTLFGGGISRGTSTLFLGPAGSGKSSLAAQYAFQAAARGEQALIFMFDELLNTFRERCAGLGMDLEPVIRNGKLRTVQVDPAELSPGEFADVVRQAVTRDKARVVVIDSLNGYVNAMPSEKLLLVQLHELLAFLGQQGVSTILILAQHGIVGGTPEAPVDTSYLADNVLLSRFFEAQGEIRQAISVIKKRTGKHERTIREMTLSSEGIRVGAPLREYQGILTGNPVPIPTAQGKQEIDGRRA